MRTRKHTKGGGREGRYLNGPTGLTVDDQRWASLQVIRVHGLIAGLMGRLGCQALDHIKVDEIRGSWGSLKKAMAGLWEQLLVVGVDP